MQRTVQLKELTLQPDEYLILCPAGQAENFTSYGTVMELSPWPSLNNDADVVELRNPKGELIDIVAYAMAWYKDAKKQQGGYSLERKRIFSACEGIQNWEASLASQGATPGAINSWTLENQITPDLAITQWEWISDTQINLFVNQELNITALSEKSSYQFSDPRIQLSDIVARAAPVNQIQLYFADALPRGITFSITLKELISCSQELDSLAAIAQKQSLKVDIYKAQGVEIGDIFISEILFNPKTGGSDFVELYNASDKILDLKDIKIGNASTSYAAVQSHLMVPKAYWVFTQNPEHLNRDYFVPNPKQVISMNQMPSFPNEKGALLIWRDSILLDRLDYHENMHFSMYKNLKGISLERISFSKESNASGNFKSSSGINGLASPTTANAQTEVAVRSDSVWVDKKVFSPNQDGFEDELALHYRFPTEE